MSDPSPVIHKDHFEPLKETLAKHATEITTIQSSISQPIDRLFTTDPTMYYRFLKSEKFDVNTTINHINTIQQFRATHNLNDIREKSLSFKQFEFPHATTILKYWPHVILHGEDKFGQPLSIERLGHSNPTLLYKNVSFDNLLLYHYYHMEQKGHLFMELSMKNDKLMRGCKILDLQGLGKQHLNTHGLSYLKQLLSISQDNYPEMMGSLFIINAPWVFNLAWKVVKPVLKEQTLNKIHILGTNYQSVLQQFIPIDNIPKEFGGRCQCNGGRGGVGPCVPVYNIEDEMTKRQIKAGDKFIARIPIKPTTDTNTNTDSEASLSVPSSSTSTSSRKGSSGVAFSVMYDIKIDHHDIQFSILFKPSDTNSNSNVQTLVAPHRYSHTEPLIDSLTLRSAGELILTFDNSYSRFTSKTVFYRVDIEELSSEEREIARELEKEEEAQQ